MPAIADEWEVVSTKPLPKQQASGDPWSVVKTEPAQPQKSFTQDMSQVPGAVPGIETPEEAAGVKHPNLKTEPLGGAIAGYGKPGDELYKEALEFSTSPETQEERTARYKAQKDQVTQKLNEKWDQVMPRLIKTADQSQKEMALTPEEQAIYNQDKSDVAAGKKAADQKTAHRLGVPVVNAIIWNRGQGADQDAQFRQNNPIAAKIQDAVQDFTSGLSRADQVAVIAAIPESKLVSVYFSYQMGTGAYQSGRQTVKDIHQGERAQAAYDATMAVLNTVAGGMAGAHGLRGAKGEVLDAAGNLVTLDREAMERDRQPSQGQWQVVGTHPDTGLPLLGDRDQVRSAWEPSGPVRAYKWIQQYQRVQAGRAARPGGRQEAAATRAGREEQVKATASARQEIADQRQKVLQGIVEEEPTRQVESQVDEAGHISYPAQFWGEQNNFGVTVGDQGHAVYRNTPRATEWLTQDGNFSENPDSLFFSKDEQTADTIARLSALSADADSEAGGEGATAEQQAEADTLAGIKRSLVAGEIDAKEAQKRAGIAEKTVLPSEFDAAREGRLTGPFSEKSGAEYASEIESRLREEGHSEEEIQSIVDSLTTSLRDAE
jgi:hypothetical protein